MVETSPKVLISYAHGDDRRMAAVLALANQLRADGVDAVIDRYVPRPERGWDNWMLDQLQSARFVLLVCDATYKLRFEGNAPPGEGLGVTWEGGIITSDLYKNQLRNKKYIPVLLQIEDRPHIPTILENQSFRVIGFGPYDLGQCPGYVQLYRDLTDQPEVLMPELGRLKALQPLPVKSTGADFKLQPVSRVRHTLTLWLQPRGDGYRYQLIHWQEFERKRTKLNTKGVGTLEEIREKFRQCLIDWNRSYGRGSVELLAEFALPLKEMMLEFDGWLSHTNAPLLKDKAFVLRWAPDRSDRERGERDNSIWEQRWRAMLEHDGRSAWTTERIHRPMIQSPFGDAVRRSRAAFCVTFTTSPDLEELREALCDGVPVAIWPRTQPRSRTPDRPRTWFPRAFLPGSRSSSVEARIHALTKKPPTDLPEVVRCDCCARKDGHPTLALFWDDPQRPLPSYMLQPVGSGES